MDLEQNSSDGLLPKDVSDYGNASTDIKANDKSVGAEDIKVTGIIKILFMLCCVVGIGYCVITGNIAGFLVFCVAGVFIMDMLGMLDSIKKSNKDMTKPGGYENIE